MCSDVNSREALSKQKKSLVQQPSQSCLMSFFVYLSYHDIISNKENYQIMFV